MSEQKYRVETCDALMRACAAGEVRLEASVRGSYPGRPMPEGVLPQVRSIGFWGAAHDQTWGLAEHRNEGIEITLLDNGRFLNSAESQPEDQRVPARGKILHFRNGGLVFSS